MINLLKYNFNLDLIKTNEEQVPIYLIFGILHFYRHRFQTTKTKSDVLMKNITDLLSICFFYQSNEEKQFIKSNIDVWSARFMNAVWDNSRFGKTSVNSNTMVNTIQPYCGQSIPGSPEVTELNQNFFGLLVNLVPGYRRQNGDINHNFIVILTDKSIIVSTSRSTYFEIKTTLWSPIKSIKLHFVNVPNYRFN